MFEKPENRVEDFMKKIKSKVVLSLVAAVVLFGGASTTLADSKTSQNLGSPTIVPFQNMEFQGGGALKNHKLTFIQNSGPGILYYDNTARKYVWVQTQSASSYTIQTVINGWMGNFGSNNFQAYRK